VNRFTVVWGRDATDGLAEIWIANANRTELSATVRAIDALLGRDPFGEYTSDLSEGLRSITVGPIRLSFAVGLDDRLVEVVGISYLPNVG